MLLKWIIKYRYIKSIAFITLHRDSGPPSNEGITSTNELIVARFTFFLSYAFFVLFSFFLFPFLLIYIILFHFIIFRQFNILSIFFFFLIFAGFTDLLVLNFFSFFVRQHNNENNYKYDKLKDFVHILAKRLFISLQKDF